jgi:hypothetical protein
MAYQIKINSVDKTSDILYNSFRITDYINQQVDTCSFECRNFKPLLNQEIEVYYDTDKIYGGVIVKVETQIRKGYSEYQVTCKDYSQYLNRELVSERYTNKTVTEIITDLLAEYAPDFTMVNVVGTSLVTSITFNRLNLSQCFEALADLLKYSWYVDSEKDIHFFAQNDEVAPFNLTETAGNHAYESLKIIEDFSQLKNQIYVIGGEYEGESRSESYVADGTQKQFPLAYKYASISRVRIVGSPDLTVGIDGEDEEANFQVFWSPKQKYLRFKDSNYPDALDVVEITGIPLFQVFVKVPDVASIAEFGLYEFKIKDTNLTSRADAIARGVVELQAYADSIEEGSFVTNTYGLRSGQTININVGDTNTDFIIQSVSMNMISPFAGQWSVKLATVKTLGIIRFLQKYLKIEDEIVEGETLLELQQFADESADSDSVDSITTHTSQDYYWGDDTTQSYDSFFDFSTWD